MNPLFHVAYCVRAYNVVHISFVFHFQFCTLHFYLFPIFGLRTATLYRSVYRSARQSTACSENFVSKTLSWALYFAAHCGSKYLKSATKYVHLMWTCEFFQANLKQIPFYIIVLRIAIPSICFRGPWLGDNPFIMSAHFWTFLTHVIYLQANILNYLPCLYNLSWQKSWKYFRWYFVQTTTSKRHFEINWPLAGNSQTVPMIFFKLSVYVF